MISADAKRWAFITLAVGGDVPNGEHGGQVLITVHEEGKRERRFETLVLSPRIVLDTTRADLSIGESRVEVMPDGRYRVLAMAREAGTGAEANIELMVDPQTGAYFPGASIGGERFVSGYAVPALRATATGSLCIAARCEAYDSAPSYHDHNWGVWQDVTWEWGSARLGAYSLLYGRVVRGGDDAVNEPLFVYLVDSLGFAGVFRPREITYVEGRSVTANGRRVTLPASGMLFDARGADTVRIDLEIEDAAATPMRARRVGAAMGAPLFLQMKGRARLTGRLNGRVLNEEGRGFFETWR